jgi:hypothetical protein
MARTAENAVLMGIPGLTSARLKIVVSPVRVWVSPSSKALTGGGLTYLAGLATPGEIHRGVANSFRPFLGRDCAFDVATA